MDNPNEKNVTISLEQAQKLAAFLPTFMMKTIPSLNHAKKQLSWYAVGSGAATAGLTAASFSFKVRGNYKWLTGLGAVVSGLATAFFGFTSYAIHKTHSFMMGETTRLFNDVKTNPQLAEQLRQKLQENISPDDLIALQKAYTNPDNSSLHAAQKIVNILFDFGQEHGYYDASAFISKSRGPVAQPALQR